MHIKRNIALYNKELIKLSFSATLFRPFSYNNIKIKNHHYKTLNISSLYILGLNVTFIPRCIVKLSKTSSPQKLFDYDCVMLYKGCVGVKPGFSIRLGISKYGSIDSFRVCVK